MCAVSRATRRPGELIEDATAALPALPGPGPGPGADGLTPQLWPATALTDASADSNGGQRAARSAGGLVRGGMGGGGRGGMAASVIGSIGPTPELLAAVATLPPARARPSLGETDPTSPDPNFRLNRLLRPMLGWLSLTAGLVGLDALATVAFPALGGLAVAAITRHAPHLLAIAVAAGLGVVIADWLSSRRRPWSPPGPVKRCCTWCGSVASRTCSGWGSTTSSARWQAGS